MCVYLVIAVHAERFTGNGGVSWQDGLNLGIRSVTTEGLIEPFLLTFC